MGDYISHVCSGVVSGKRRHVKAVVEAAPVVERCKVKEPRLCGFSCYACIIIFFLICVTGFLALTWYYMRLFASGQLVVAANQS